MHRYELCGSSKVNIDRHKMSLMPSVLNKPSVIMMLSSCCRNNDPDPEQQLASMRTDMAEKDQKINSLEKYIAGIMKDGITNNVVLKELHEALAAKDSSIAELQRYIDLELKTESASEVEQEAASAVPDGITDGFRFASERSAKPGNGDESSSEADSAEPEILSFGQTTLKISQLKAQIHRLESRLDSSSSEASSDDGEVRFRVQILCHCAPVSLLHALTVHLTCLPCILWQSQRCCRGRMHDACPQAFLSTGLRHKQAI